VIPDYLEPLTGWRRFNLRQRGSLLVSANYPTPWPTRDPGEACCIAEANAYFTTLQGAEDWEPHAPDDPVPQLGCTCGFYAFKDRARAEDHHQGSVLARVALWGRVAVHVHGYRAQRIRIEELFCDHRAVVTPQALRERYQIPVTEVESTWTLENPSGSSSSNPSSSQGTGKLAMNQQSLATNQPPPFQWSPSFLLGSPTPPAIQAVTIDPRAFVSGLSPVERRLVFDEIQRHRVRAAWQRKPGRGRRCSSR